MLCHLLLWHESGIMKVLLKITGLSYNLYNALNYSDVRGELNSNHSIKYCEFRMST